MERTTMSQLKARLRAYVEKVRALLRRGQHDLSEGRHPAAALRKETSGRPVVVEAHHELPRRS